MIFALKTVLTEKLSNKWEFVIWIKQTKMSMSVYMPAVLRILLLKRYLAICLYRIVCGWSTNRKPIIPKLISKNTIGHIFSLYIIYNGKRPLFVKTESFIFQGKQKLMFGMLNISTCLPKKRTGSLNGIAALNIRILKLVYCSSDNQDCA